MKTQQHRNMRHSQSTQNYSLTSISPTLPPIYPNNHNLHFFNPTHSGDLTSLKKYLSNLNFQIHELKISQNKLNKDSKQNKILIQEAITLSKSTPYPINLQMLLLQESKESQISNTNETQEQSNPNSNCNNNNNNALSSCNDERSTIPKESFQKLQAQKRIFTIKHEITYNKRLIKEKENEISNLKLESKVNRLITKNNNLIDTTNKIQWQSDKITEIENNIIPQKQNMKESIQSQISYQKAINNSLRQENTSIKERFATADNVNNKHAKNINALHEKCNNMKYKMNIAKQTETKRVNEIKLMNEKKQLIPQLKDIIQQNENELKTHSYEVDALKEENDNKQKCIDKLIEENKRINNQKNICARNIQRECYKEKEEFYNIRSQNECIDKDILVLKRENLKLQQQLEKADKQYKKKVNEIEEYKMNWGNEVSKVLVNELEFAVVRLEITDEVQEQKEVQPNNNNNNNDNGNNGEINNNNSNNNGEMNNNNNSNNNNSNENVNNK